MASKSPIKRALTSTTQIVWVIIEHFKRYNTPTKNENPPQKRRVTTIKRVDSYFSIKI
jgi:hypothetical protein